MILSLALAIALLSPLALPATIRTAIVVDGGALSGGAVLLFNHNGAFEITSAAAGRTGASACARSCR